MWPFIRKPRWRIELREGGILGKWEAVIYDTRDSTLWVVGGDDGDDALINAVDYISTVKDEEMRQRNAVVYVAD